MSLNRFFLTLILTFFIYSQGRDIPSPPKFDGAKATNLRDAQLQDLALFEPYLKLNKTYTNKNRQKAKAIYNRLKINAGKISKLEFLVEIHRAIALGDNAHSEGRLGLFPKQFGSLPFRGYWFDNKYYIIRTAKGFEGLLGSQVTHIGDRAIEDIALQLKELSGGPLIFFKAVSGDNAITNPHLLKHYKLIKSEDQVTIKLIKDGVYRDIVLSPNSAGAKTNPSTASQRLLYPDYQFSDWSHVIDNKKLPTYLAGSKTYQFIENSENSLLYLQFRANRGNGIKQFLNTSQQKMMGKTYHTLIVDMRKNTGGNFMLTHQFFKEIGNYLTKNGKIYVITSEVTFSAGIVGVAFLKFYWQDKVKIIGERIGDREAFWAEMRRYKLPNSEIKLTYSDALHDLKNPDSFNKETYYWWYKSNVNPVVGSLDPDIHVVTTFDDYKMKRDPVLEKIRQLEHLKIAID